MTFSRTQPWKSAKSRGISQAQRNLTETRDERKFIDIGHTTQVTQKMHHALRFYSCFFMCLVVFLDLVDWNSWLEEKPSCLKGGKLYEFCCQRMGSSLHDPILETDKMAFVVTVAWLLFIQLRHEHSSCLFLNRLQRCGCLLHFAPKFPCSFVVQHIGGRGLVEMIQGPALPNNLQKKQMSCYCWWFRNPVNLTSWGW